MSLAVSGLLRRLGPLARMLGGGWDGGGGGGSAGAGGGGRPGSLAPGEVHAWCVFPRDVTDPALLQAYRHVLSPPELDSLTGALTDQVRKERLLARVLVRTTLARYLGGGAAAGELAFSAGAHGKPSLARGAGWAAGALEFNLAHTPSLIMIAVSRPGRPVGVDVEETARATRSDPLRLARRRFAAGEVAALEVLAEEDPAAAAARFIALWTLKEAHVKCTGAGISIPPGLKGFDLRFDPWPGGGAALAAECGLPTAPEGVVAISVAAGGAGGAGGVQARGMHYVLLRPGRDHTAGMCVGAGEGAETDAPRVSLWRTVPMLWEEPLEGDGVEVVGWSPPSG